VILQNCKFAQIFKLLENVYLISIVNGKKKKKKNHFIKMKTYIYLDILRYFLSQAKIANYLQIYLIYF